MEIESPSELRSLGCPSIDEAPSHLIFGAALSAVNAWMRWGTPPPSAPRMDVQQVDGVATVESDKDGAAIGGIHGPWERVPVAAYSGKAPAEAPGTCVLFGTTHPFSASKLAALYGSKSDYLEAYTKATDDDIKAGHILPVDKTQVLAFAQQVLF